VGILTHLRTHETASPSDFAGELELALGAVSYHVRRLEQIGLIELVEVQQRRGALQHYYALSIEAAGSDLVRQVTTRARVRRGEPSQAHARALLDATAIGELRAELRHLFERLRALEAQTVRRAGMKGRARTFAVEVSCVMDGD
jgi:DNA-binding MarR family transcriptional regulator